MAVQTQLYDLHVHESVFPLFCAEFRGFDWPLMQGSRPSASEVLFFRDAFGLPVLLLRGTLFSW